MRRNIFVLALLATLAGCATTLLTPEMRGEVLILENRSPATIVNVGYKPTKSDTWVTDKRLLAVPLDPGKNEGILFADLGTCGEYDLMLVFDSVVNERNGSFRNFRVLEGIAICDQSGDRLVFEDPNLLND